MGKAADHPVLSNLGIQEITEPGEAVPPLEAPHCGVCGDVIRGPETTCPQCDAPHHAECWEYNEGCSIYGCQGVLAELQPEGVKESSLIQVLDGTQPESGRIILDRLASIPSTRWSILGALLLFFSFVLAASDLRARGLPGMLSGLFFVGGNLFLWLSPLIEEILLWGANRHRPRRLTSLRDSSTRELQAKLTRNPKDLSTLTSLCLVHFAREEWKQAASLYERALGMAPGEPNLLFRYAKCLDRLGQEERAKEVFTRLLTEHEGHHCAKNAFHWLDRISRLRKLQKEQQELQRATRPERD